MSATPGAHPDWIAPEWSAPPAVKALVTTRAGGVSAPPYDSLNLGFSTGDDPRAVEENRRRVRALLPEEPRWLKQVHGARVVVAETVADRPEADAAVTRESNVVCAILVADCLPVLMCDRAGTVIAAAHAGWRGLAAGVIDNTVQAMRTAGARDVLAYIGPGIGPRAFEVGRDVFEAYVTRDSAAADAFMPARAGKWLADLPALARRALRRCGVLEIHGGNLCTHSDARRFYSYRREPTTGRMGALIWRE
ncbi:MAG TPA: peptidoglycan editing factor PgeF [Burkholderiales bacterium]|nr:peptidoglycan editing factor PgeF [Burkholderiales bacterium]